MLKGILLAAFATCLYSGTASAMGCFSGDREISRVTRFETGFCTTENYCVMFDYDIRWNYDQTYFNKHTRCPGEQNRYVDVITCARKGTQQQYYAYNDGPWSRCLRTQ